MDGNCDQLETCYRDQDLDGWRTDAVTAPGGDMYCVNLRDAPAIWPSGDCDDGDGNRNPGEHDFAAAAPDRDCDGRRMCSIDEDGDGYIGPTEVLSPDLSCAHPGMTAYVAHRADCDDHAALVHPGATEVVGDGVDQDCSQGERCWSDADRDGHPDVGATSVLSVDDDCDDSGEAGSLPVDVCWGSDAAGDPDGDGWCSDVDICPLLPGEDGDVDGVCDGMDQCAGDDSLGDGDGDGRCDGLILDLQVDTPSVGRVVVARISGAPAGADVRLYASVVGRAAGPCLPGGCLQLDHPILLDRATAPPAGGVDLMAGVPIGSPTGGLLTVRAVAISPAGIGLSPHAAVRVLA